MIKWIILETLHNILIPLTNKHTGSLISFDDGIIAQKFANETCDWPHIVLAVPVG